MKVGIFYFSLKPGKDRQPIKIDVHRYGYVRVVIVRASDLSEALSVAKPQRDETVMSTHEIE